MSDNIDVTEQLKFEISTDCILYLNNCVCGESGFLWIDTDSKEQNKMPCCGRKFFFDIEARVYEVIDAT